MEVTAEAIAIEQLRLRLEQLERRLQAIEVLQDAHDVIMRTKERVESAR